MGGGGEGRGGEREGCRGEREADRGGKWRGREARMGLVQVEVEVERTSLKQALLPPNLLQADGLNKMCLA